MIEMIVLDLDNTLLNSDESISEKSIETLKKCQVLGIKIAFATARSTQSAARFFKQFRPDVFIGYGGALILEKEKIIYRFDISAEISTQIIKECLASSEICVKAINENIAFTNNLKYLADSPHYQFADSLSEYSQSFLKISLESTQHELIEKLATKYPMLNTLRYTGEDLYQFTNRDAVKWNALAVVAKHYNIDVNKFIAFGDDVNDLEMLEKCGIGVAVSNAIDAIKAVADDICDTNDNDGVAKWLDEHILTAQGRK